MGLLERVVLDCEDRRRKLRNFDGRILNPHRAMQRPCRMRQWRPGWNAVWIASDRPACVQHVQLIADEVVANPEGACDDEQRQHAAPDRRRSGRFHVCLSKYIQRVKSLK